jgi:hypothetical protein
MCSQRKDWLAVPCPEINTGVAKYLISFVPRANTNLAVTLTKRDQNQYRHLSRYTVSSPAYTVFDSHSRTSNLISAKVTPLQSSNVFKLFSLNSADTQLPFLLNHLRLPSQEAPSILILPALDPRYIASGRPQQKTTFPNNSSVVIEVRLLHRCIETVVLLLLSSC